MKDGFVRFRNKIYVSYNNELENLILRELHVKPYSSHPGYQKTLKAVKKLHYWSNLKKEVAKFVSKCFDCQQVKVECKHPTNLLQPILIPKWKWEVISIDFITSLS